MSEQKRLYRSRDDRMIAGVCAGLAEYMDIDPTLVRLAMVLFTLVGGSGILVYVIAWIIMPERPEELPNV
jgi:phage shock protein C